MLIERFKIKRCVYNRSHGLADFKVNNLVKLISFFIGNKQFEPDQALLIRSLRGRLVNKNKLRAFGGRSFNIITDLMPGNGLGGVVDVLHDAVISKDRKSVVSGGSA